MISKACWFTCSVYYYNLLQKKRLHLCSGHGHVVAQQVPVSWCQTKRPLHPPPPPRGRQQRVMGGNSPILWISVTFQSNFLASCKRFPICLVPPSSSEQSGHICVRQSSAGDFRHWKMNGNVSAMNKYTQQLPFIPPSLQQMLQLDRVFSPMVQCGSTFVYLSSHSLTCLEWMRKLDVRAQNLRVCMCRWRTSLKEITPAPSCTRWGSVTPL